MVDWSRMMTSTSPYLFEEISETNTRFIEHNKKKHKYNIFIRKISPDFPDDVLKYYIYKYSKNEDDELVIIKPFIYYKKIICMMFLIATIGFVCGIYFIIM
jgi:hypothetical protein